MIDELRKYIRTMLPSVLMLLAAGWFTACSSEEEVTEMPDASGQKAIAFGGAVGSAEQGKPAMRAGTSNLEEHKTSFQVWGYKNTIYREDGYYDGAQTVFPGYTVRYNGQPGSATDNTRGWYYVGTEGSVEQTPKYWDYGAVAYRFFAVAGHAPSIFHATYDTSEGTVVWTSVQNLDSNTPTYFSRLWFSNNSHEQNMPEFGKPVELNFFQPFCRVRIMFVDAQGQPLTKSSEVTQYIEPASISFEPINDDDARKVHSKGTFHVMYYITGKNLDEEYYIDPSMEDGYVKISIPYESHANDADYALVSPGNKEHWYRLFPSHGDDYPFALTLRYKGMLRTAIVPKEYTHWDLNHEYTYVFKIDDKKMEFYPELFVYDRWQSGYTVDVPAEW